MLTVQVILGTRPELIKLAPVIRDLRQRPGVRVEVCATGQHRELLDPLWEVFQLTPDVSLPTSEESLSLPESLGRLLTRLAPVVRARKPDWVVVQGDTTSALAGGLTGFQLGSRVLHVEAGLRTSNPRRPFPEEMNRRLLTRLADRHAAPTELARAALLAEGVPAPRIAVTGNSGLDTLLWVRETLGKQPPRRIAELLARARPGKKLLVTCHRRENLGAGLASLCEALRQLQACAPDLTIYFPLHANPQMRGPVLAALSPGPTLELLEPLPYPEFVALLDRVDLVLTDSGGVQEEAPALGKPVLVLRGETERSEAVTAGAARLVEIEPQALVAAVRAELAEQARPDWTCPQRWIFGDGQAASRIGDFLLAANAERDAETGP